MKHFSATGALMQIIDILGDQSQLRHVLVEVPDCAVPFVWRLTQCHQPMPLVPGSLNCQFISIERPQSPEWLHESLRARL